MTVRAALRLVLLLLTAGAFTGCPSLTQRGELPASIDRAQQLERSGDPAGAARVYEQLAAQNSGTDRTGMLLHAARDYLTAQRTNEAARVLGAAQGPYSAEQVSEQALLNAQLALVRGQPQEALRLLNAIAVPTGAEQAARYRELRASAAALVAAHPEPPRPVTPGAAGPHIALLLPMSGRAASASISVRDGFMTAYYQAPASERPRVQIYDTGAASVADVLTQALGAGADFIVGPLTREEVTAAADFPGLHVPLLALNFLPPEHVPPAQFYQYALSPEEEARLVARRVLEESHRRGVALIPAGEWGTRVLGAFRQELQAGGGDLLATAQLDSGRTDYSAAITEVLRINDSTARFHRLESILGTKLQFEPRRRNDIEFIFAPAPANLERLVRPQLRFHFAGDIPTYATSDAFEPDTRANEDLEGLMFPDMPWMLGGDLADAVRAASREAWPSGNAHRGRLFAFGFDAFRLAQALRHPAVSGTLSVAGLTGRLSLDAQRRVHRELGWAQIHDGELRLLPGD